MFERHLVFRASFVIYMHGVVAQDAVLGIAPEAAMQCQVLVALIAVVQIHYLAARPTLLPPTPK